MGNASKKLDFYLLSEGPVEEKDKGDISMARSLNFLQVSQAKTCVRLSPWMHTFGSNLFILS